VWGVNREKFLKISFVLEICALLFFSAKSETKRIGENYITDYFPPFGLIQKVRKRSRLRIMKATPNDRLSHFNIPISILSISAGGTGTKYAVSSKVLRSGF